MPRITSKGVFPTFTSLCVVNIFPSVTPTPKVVIVGIKHVFIYCISSSSSQRDNSFGLGVLLLFGRTSFGYREAEFCVD
jgi:hypothetical protein